MEVPQRYRNYVEKAIMASVSMLTIQEFIEMTGISFDRESFDRLYMSMDDDKLVYVDDAMLDWMGYAGESFAKIKNFKALLTRNFTDADYKILKNTEYNQFLIEYRSTHIRRSNSVEIETIQTYDTSYLPPPASGSSAGRKTHILLEPDTFRDLCMMIHTEKGMQIRTYYKALERLMKAYTYYQSIFRLQEAERSLLEKNSKIEAQIIKIDELMRTINMNESLAEERFNKLLARSETIADKLDETTEILEDTRTEVISASATIERMAGNCVVPTSVKPSNLEVFAIFQNMNTGRLRVACVQRMSYARTYKDYQADLHPIATREVLKIEYNANAGIFWIAFYKKYGAIFVRNKSGKQFDLAPNKTIDELCAVVRQAIDEQKIESTV